jgi:hypothetical protein
MVQRTFRVSASVSSDTPSAIESILGRIFRDKGTIRPTSEGFEVEGNLEGESAPDLNRMLLSELRRAEKRTRIRAEWISCDTVERFFDYVPKGSRKLNQHGSTT